VLIMNEKSQFYALGQIKAQPDIAIL